MTYTNADGEEFEQPAGIVLLCAYAINNVHLMLLSGIGAPYDPAAQRASSAGTTATRPAPARRCSSKAGTSTRS